MESQVSELFPGYVLLIGSEYSIEGVRLDLLLQKENELLVIELKAGTATYGVFGQISMYMGYIKEKFPENDVYGVIVASEIHKGLKAACSTSNFVTCKKYNMKLSIENV
jgi:RecB family endonuclease NucS